MGTPGCHLGGSRIQISVGDGKGSPQPGRVSDHEEELPGAKRAAQGGAGGDGLGGDAWVWRQEGGQVGTGLGWVGAGHAGHSWSEGIFSLGPGERQTPLYRRREGVFIQGRGLCGSKSHGHGCAPAQGTADLCHHHAAPGHCLTCDREPESSTLATSPASLWGRPGQPLPDTVASAPASCSLGPFPLICTTRAGQEGGRWGMVLAT